MAASNSSEGGGSLRPGVPAARALQVFLTTCAGAMLDADARRTAGVPPPPSPDGPPGLCPAGSTAYRDVWDATIVDVVP